MHRPWAARSSAAPNVRYGPATRLGFGLGDDREYDTPFGTRSRMTLDDFSGACSLGSHVVLHARPAALGRLHDAHGGAPGRAGGAEGRRRVLRRPAGIQDAHPEAHASHESSRRGIDPDVCGRARYRSSPKAASTSRTEFSRSTTSIPLSIGRIRIAMRRSGRAPGGRAVSGQSRVLPSRHRPNTRGCRPRNCPRVHRWLHSRSPAIS